MIGLAGPRLRTSSAVECPASSSANRPCPMPNVAASLPLLDFSPAFLFIAVKFLRKC